MRAAHGDVRPAELLAVPVDGGEVTVGRWGDGDRVVVAAHGLTASHVSWTWVAEALGDDVTLYAPDLRGRGGSAGLPPPYGLTQHARDCVAVLDHVGTERAVLAGHSMGAFVAARVLVESPDRVESAVLIDGGLPFSVPDGMTADELVTATVGPAMERLSMTFGSVAEYHDYWRAHPSFQGDDWTSLTAAYFAYDVDEGPGGWSPKVVADVVRADGRDIVTAATPPSDFLTGSVPVTFVWAPRGVMDEDPLYPWERVEKMTDEHPDVEVIRLRDVNHYTLALRREGAVQVADAIRGALRAGSAAW